MSGVHRSAPASPGAEHGAVPATSTKPAAPSEAELASELRLAFAPLQKRAFGIAVGTALSLLVVALTLFHVILAPDSAMIARLLRQYFYGYTVSWTGVLVGGFWGFVVGFVMGWFAAFCRNLAVAISVFITLTRVELSETRDFLDHI